MSNLSSALARPAQAENSRRLKETETHEPRQFQRIEHRPKHLSVGRTIVAAARARASSNPESMRLCLIDEVDGQPGIGASEKVAYRFISRKLRADKGDAWVSMQDIADAMARNVRTAKRTVRKLEELGLILVVKRRFENAYKIVGLNGVEAAEVVFRSVHVKGRSDIGVTLSGSEIGTRSDTDVTLVGHGDEGRSDIDVTHEVTRMSGRSDMDVTFLLPLPSSTASSTPPL